MKWIKKNFSEILIGTIITAIPTALGFIFGWFDKTFCLPFFWLIVIAIIPVLISILYPSFIKRRKKAYKRGDFVKVIADNRKFMIIRYHRLLAKYAICKEINGNVIFTVHEDFLTPYQDSEHHAINERIAHPMSGIPIKSSSITRL